MHICNVLMHAISGEYDTEYRNILITILAYNTRVKCALSR